MIIPFIKRYGIGGSLYLATCIVRTRLFFPGARLVRFPVDVRNKRYFQWGKGFTTGVGCRIETHPQPGGPAKLLIIGDNFQMNDQVHIVAGQSVTIGNNVLIASKVFITDLQHGFYGHQNRHDHPDGIPADRELSFSPVEIQDNVWIGEFVSVLPGVTIGKGSIIGTMSVVTKSIPPYSIAVGSPAKVIKQFNFTTGQWEKI